MVCKRLLHEFSHRLVEAREAVGIGSLTYRSQAWPHGVGVMPARAPRNVPGRVAKPAVGIGRPTISNPDILSERLYARAFAV
jgi:hypothetical protein